MAGYNNGLIFHGSYKAKEAAQRKARKVGKDAFILRKWVGRGRKRWAYTVAERDTATDFDFGFAAPAKKSRKRGKRGRK